MTEYATVKFVAFGFLLCFVQMIATGFVISCMARKIDYLEDQVSDLIDLVSQP